MTQMSRLGHGSEAAGAAGTNGALISKPPLNGEVARRRRDGEVLRAVRICIGLSFFAAACCETSQSASLTAPLSGEPLAFAALRVTTSSVALVDAVGRRPRWSCVTAAVRKRKRSGKRPAHQAGRRMQSQICLAPRTVCGCSPDAVCRGRIPKVGGPPPAFGGVFLPRFFLRYRRKNRAPGGR